MYKYTHTHTHTHWGNSESPYICSLKTKTCSQCPAKWGGVMILTFSRWCLHQVSWKREKWCTLDRETTHTSVRTFTVMTFAPKKDLSCTFQQPPENSVSEQKKNKKKQSLHFLADTLIWIAGTSSSLCPRCKTKALTSPFFHFPLHLILNSVLKNIMFEATV